MTAAASREYLLGLDLGGSGVRCLLLELHSGEVTCVRRSSAARVAPDTAGLGFDLDLVGISKALGSACREALARAEASPQHVLGIAATSMRLGMAVLDADGEPLLAVPNRDARAVGQGLTLAAEHGDEFRRFAGRTPHPAFAAARLRWLIEERPETMRRAAHFLSLSDWVTWRLCGEVIAEPSQAAESLLFDLASQNWAWDWIDRLEIPRTLFPELRPCGSRAGALTSQAATELGLRAGIPVCVGGADTQCGLLGTAAVAAGDIALIAGTTAPLQQVVDRPLIDPDARIWTGHHVVADRWVLESNLGPVGDSLDWLARILYPDAPSALGGTAILLAEAGESEPGAAGILSTFGVQVMNARQPGIPIGNLTLSHLPSESDAEPRRHVARSVVEGIACGLRANLEQLQRVSGVPASDQLRLAGRLSRSESFGQILADVLAAPLEVASVCEASALGAALCAAVGAGASPDLEQAAHDLVPAGESRIPGADCADAYRDLYTRWNRLRLERSDADESAAAMVIPFAFRAGAAASVTATAELRPKILVTADCDDPALAALAALGEVEYASYRDKRRMLTGPSLVETLQGVEVFVTEIDLVDADALEKLPELRVIASCRGDAVNIDVDACTAFGIPLLRTPGRNADAVADLTLAFLLMLARDLPAASAFLHAPDITAGDMGKMGQAFGRFRGRELWNKTVGLVGLGAVGAKVCQRLRGFGTRVLVADPYVPAERAAALGAECVSLAELLAESDFVSLHAAVTAETTGMLAAPEFAMLKPGACLVNTARAALLDEDDLLEALRSGALAGAALDTFAVEPPGSDHPLLALPNVIATPHVGGNTRDVASHQGEIVVAELSRLLTGRRPCFTVNPEVLDDFDWSRPRPRPGAKLLARLKQGPAPAVSDLQKKQKTQPKRGAGETRSEATGASAPPASTLSSPAPSPSSPSSSSSSASSSSASHHPEVQSDRASPQPDAALSQASMNAMRAILVEFVKRIVSDDALRRSSQGRDVTLHFRLEDAACEFHFRLFDGSVQGAVGPPAASADVQLRMRADVLDGMFTGRLNPMEAAMEGRLAFTGDAAKAMTLQQLQGDLSRLYSDAREQVGDPGDLTPSAPATSPVPVEAGDIREELVAVVEELYRDRVITATGGNVSVRIPGEDAVWITPSQLFKGNLQPEQLVRLDLEGRSLDPGARSPSSEWDMHCAVLQAKSEANAVIHAHAPNSTILANTGLPFVPISTEAAFFGDIPRVPFIMPGTPELAAAVADAITDGWAVLLTNHGIVVAGRSLRRAADMVEIIERSAEVILGCHAVGREPPTLPQEIVKQLRELGDLVA